MGDEINDFKKKLNTVPGWEKPSVFDLNNEADVANLNRLINSNKIYRISDNIGEAIEELYHIANPSQIDKADPEAYQAFVTSFGNGNYDMYGRWVYFPWSGNITHFPTKNDLGRLRGSRNRNLVTEEERKTLIEGKTILVLGLSVGSNAVDSLLMQGIGSKYVLVDMDNLAPSNLNRIRASYDQIGIHKVDIVAKKISELDPFLEQVHYKNGINEDNIEGILADHKPDIIIDEMDSLRMKILIRMHAQRLRIPLIMATDDGDDILLDIERYDLSADLPILHGILPQPIIDDLLNDKQMDRREAGAIIGKYFVGLENVPLRMLESLSEIGKSLPSWPQLGGAAVLSGLYLAYATRKILLGQNINSGRFLMGPEPQLNPDIVTSEYKDKKTRIIDMMNGH